MRENSLLDRQLSREPFCVNIEWFYLKFCVLLYSLQNWFLGCSKLEIVLVDKYVRITRLSKRMYAFGE